MNCYLQHPDAIKPQNMQVWNNAVFDVASPNSGGRHLRLVSCSDKENRTPILPIMETPKPQHLPIKPAMKVHFKIGVDEQAEDEHRTIDSEIEAIEKEIKRLTTILEDLRLQREERDLKVAMDVRRGRIVAARFMDPNNNNNNNNNNSVTMTTMKKKNKKFEETPAREKFRRRGLSLGPLEITPVKTTANTRRMSCFPTTENKINSSGRRRRQSVSVSPKSRGNPIPKLSDLRKGVESAGVGSKKAMRNKSGAPMSLNPKSLFQTKKSSAAAASKRSMKGRPVPSRYSTATTTTQTPERKRRRWSIPDGPIMISASEESPEETKYPPPPPLVSLPKIRTGAAAGGGFKSPRDSGSVKRAGEMNGRRSHFGGIMESTCCQNLSFEEFELHHPYETCNN